ncbi:putative DNA-binding transcriptional regulator YafY [Diaminobutyricimonas aerilata]|uniref:Putative DNA-binding transcriptional regulator YafY n=1 Tax=Diaminobutyricimonas aerilata TaxID=1162967 RepID=A0A2M9CJX4_9MICO|nr:WYL domain-containing protein [Diaminobutyricimonas aerilata]PJJ72202.1 putative DNA-binding transcriptional regulator YafY [Diaminobutyricimonas aerilata]
MSTAQRRLETLALLQSHPGVSAPRLARMLGVTERTARRDVAHLRELGYRIDAEAGPAGGYRLAHGSTMPPLLLDADEVAAVALGLRTAATADGLETAAVTALAKLTQVVPARWRSRLDAFVDVQAAAPPPRCPGLDVLVATALACRAEEALRIRHRRSDTAPAVPIDVQPHRLVAVRRRWYLVAAPRNADQWHVYALDRVDSVQPLTARLPAPEAPLDATALVIDTLANGPWRYRIRVAVHTSGDLVRERVDPAVATVVNGEDDECELRFSTDDLDWAARWIAHLEFDIDVIEPAALTERLRALGRWLLERY